MKRNMKKWMYNLLSSQDIKAMPIISFPGAELKSMNVLDVASKGKNQYESIKALSDIYPSIANVTCMDLSVEAEAFGCEIRFTDIEVPTVIKGVINDVEDVKGLTIPNVGDGRTGEYIKAAELAASNIKDRPTFAGMIGPYSLSGRLYDMTEIMTAIMTDPDEMHDLLQRCTKFLIAYANAFKTAGANGIIIAEPAAGLLSPQLCQEFSSEYVKEIVDAVQDEYFMVILHNCGKTEKLVDSLVSTGAMGLHFGNAVDMTKIMPQIPWGRLAMGNIDPVSVLRYGSVDDVIQKTEELLWKAAIYKNFVLSTGCDVPFGSPQSNIQAFYDALEKFNHSIMIEITA